LPEEATFRLRLGSRRAMPGRGNSIKQGHEVGRLDFREKFMGLSSMNRREDRI